MIDALITAGAAFVGSILGAAVAYAEQALRDRAKGGRTRRTRATRDGAE